VTFSKFTLSSEFLMSIMKVFIFCSIWYFLNLYECHFDSLSILLLSSSYSCQYFLFSQIHICLIAHWILAYFWFNLEVSTPCILLWFYWAIPEKLVRVPLGFIGTKIPELSSRLLGTPNTDATLNADATGCPVFVQSHGFGKILGSPERN
jgi:hypothetical protein